MKLSAPTRISLRVLALGYLFVLLVLPLGVILIRSFGHGSVAFIDQIGTPAAISAINLSLLIVAIVVPVNVVFGVLIGAGWMPRMVAAVVACIISILAISVFIQVTGGPSSPYFPTLTSIPLLIAMFTPDARLPTILAGGLTLITVIVLDVLAGMPPQKMMSGCRMSHAW